MSDSEKTPETEQTAEEEAKTTAEETKEADTAADVLHTEQTETADADMPQTEPETADTGEQAENADTALTDEQRIDNSDLAFVAETNDTPLLNPFISSLEEITPDDLGAPPKKAKRDPIDLAITAFRTLIFWAAVAVFFYAGYQVVYKLYAYRQADDIYSSIADSIFSGDSNREGMVAYAQKSAKSTTLTPVNGTKTETEDGGDETEEYDEIFEMLKGQLSLLQKKNEEVVGWIRMEGDTEINYPIVQHEDDEYYLHYAYDGTYNPAGSIFLDHRNSVTVSSNRHTIIYGHNMDSGSPMFANLLHYQDGLDFWKKNRYVYIYTQEAKYVYEVFAAYETSPIQISGENHPWRMSFNKDDAVFMQWVSDVRARSDISPDVEVDASDRILTLSTCTNINDQRYVVHCVLISSVK